MSALRDLAESLKIGDWDASSHDAEDYNAGIEALVDALEAESSQVLVVEGLTEEGLRITRQREGMFVHLAGELRDIFAAGPNTEVRTVWRDGEFWEIRAERMRPLLEYLDRNMVPQPPRWTTQPVVQVTPTGEAWEATYGPSLRALQQRVNDFVTHQAMIVRGALDRIEHPAFFKTEAHDNGPAGDYHAGIPMGQTLAGAVEPLARPGFRASWLPKTVVQADHYREGWDA